VYEPRALARLFLGSGIYVLAGMGGISINDAMCYGCPVLYSVCDGTERRLVVDGETGVRFREGDAADLAAKIATLWERPDRLDAMSAAGTRRIREVVNVYAVLDRYLYAFESVCGCDLAAAHAHLRAEVVRGGYDPRCLGKPYGQDNLMKDMCRYEQ
jgi:glycosyltransferase involved in cell wall biosynthesis